MRDSEHDANLYMSGGAHAVPTQNMCPNVAGGSPSGDAAADEGMGDLRSGRCKSGPLTNDWNAPNGHLIPASLRSARAVIEAGYLWRCEQNERFVRRRECGARAVGMLEALLHMGELAECYREQAREIISEWER